MNEKTIQQKYLELCNEIEKLPASEQQTKVITMFCQFKKDTDALLADAVAAYDKKLGEDNALIKELVEDTKRLNKALDCYPSDRTIDILISRDEEADSEHWQCIMPNEKNEAQESHSALMQKVKEVEG